MRNTLWTALALAVLCPLSHAQTTLGAFTFNDNQFGDSLVEMDGGFYAPSNWLNTTNADPGNPGYLTGVNFETGVANIPQGIGYRIFYNTPIVNGVGDDLAVVTARFSADDFGFAVSEDGIGWTPGVTISGGPAVATGVTKSYFYGGTGPHSAELFVQTLDLSNYGVLLGNSVVGVEINGIDELDLIRVAGLGVVPEPCSMVAFAGVGLAALARRRASRRS